MIRFFAVAVAVPGFVAARLNRRIGSSTIDVIAVTWCGPFATDVRTTFQRRIMTTGPKSTRRADGSDANSS